MRRNSKTRRYVWILFLVGIGVSWPIDGYSAINLWPVRFETMISPFRLAGETGYTFSSNMAKDERPSVDQMFMTDVGVSKGAKGFVWKPWLVRWDAGVSLGVTHTQQKVISSPSSTDASGNDSLMRRMKGKYDVFVFPKSRFPFKTYYERALGDSSEGEVYGQGDSNEKIGFSQDYQDKDGSTMIFMGGEHEESIS